MRNSSSNGVIYTDGDLDNFNKFKLNQESKEKVKDKKGFPSYNALAALIVLIVLSLSGTGIYFLVDSLTKIGKEQEKKKKTRKKKKKK